MKRTVSLVCVNVCRICNQRLESGERADAEQQEEALKRAFLYHMHDDTSAWVGALLWIVCWHDTPMAFLGWRFWRKIRIAEKLSVRYVASGADSRKITIWKPDRGLNNAWSEDSIPSECSPQQAKRPLMPSVSARAFYRPLRIRIKVCFQSGTFCCCEGVRGHHKELRSIADYARYPFRLVELPIERQRVVTSSLSRTMLPRMR